MTFKARLSHGLSQSAESGRGGLFGCSFGRRPIFDHEPRNPAHLLDVGCHQDGTVSESMRSDRNVEVLEPATDAFQARLDHSEGFAHCIGPHDRRDLMSDVVETSHQQVPPLRSWQALESISNLGDHGLGNTDVRSRVASETPNRCEVGAHHRRNDVGVQDVPHSLGGGLEPPRLARSPSIISSTRSPRSVAVVSLSMKPGAHPRWSTSFSCAWMISLLRLILRIRAFRSTAARSFFGICTLVGTSIL